MSQVTITRFQDGDAMIKRIWIDRGSGEDFDAAGDNADVLVETEDGLMWSASFVTIPYLQRQMELSRDVANDADNMQPVRFVAIETPHVIVENLSQDSIEDTIDNLMTLGIFESVFALYSEEVSFTNGEDETTDSQTETNTLKG
jgi:hypothetical protein